MPQFKSLSSDEELAPETSIDGPFPMSVSTDLKTEVMTKFRGFGLETFLAMFEIFFVRRYLDLLVINSTLSTGISDKIQLSYVFIIKPMLLR